MELSQVFYNQERQIYEVNSPDAKVATYFVFPPTLQPGDKLPPLYIHAWDKDVIFKFDGEYNANTDNLEFFIEGPIGYVYKISLQIDLPEQTYGWKIKRHGHTNVGRDNGATRLFVPRALCLSSQTLVESEQEVVKRWTFYGQSVPQQFGRLRMKVSFFPARCGENPDNNYPRGSKGLYRYFKEEEPAAEAPRGSAPFAGFSHKQKGVSGAGRAAPMDTPKKEPGPPTHLKPSKASKDKKDQAKCCCFLAQVPHDHNEDCGSSHIHSSSPHPTGSTPATDASNITGRLDSEDEAIGGGGGAAVPRPQLMYRTPSSETTSNMCSVTNTDFTFQGNSFTTTAGTATSDTTGALGCNNMFDVACLRADDGLQLLDDSTNVNPLEMVGNACCGNADATFLSSTSNIMSPDISTSFKENVSSKLSEAPAAPLCSSPSAPKPVLTERKIDLNKHTSLANLFPPRLCSQVLPKASCPTVPGCNCNTSCNCEPNKNQDLFRELAANDKGKSQQQAPKRPPKITRNYNQRFAIADIKIDYEHNTLPEAKKPLHLYRLNTEDTSSKLLDDCLKKSTESNDCGCRSTCDCSNKSAISLKS